MPSLQKYFYPKNVLIANTRLTPVAITRIKGKIRYKCQCSCGNVIFPTPCEIGKRTFSCGCLSQENKIKNGTTHGLSKTKEYAASFNAFTRCRKPNSKYWKWYGGRGIEVKFKTIEEMTRWLINNLPRPSGKYFLDRIDNDGHYEPGNIRWLTSKESANLLNPA